MEDLFQSQKPNLEEEIKPSKAVHFWQIGGGLFVLLVFLLGLFVWHARYVKDSLIQFAPVDTAVYLSVRNSFWPWEDVKIKDLPLSHIFSHHRLLELSSHAAYLKIPGEEKFETASIFFLKHIEEAVPVIEELEFAAALDKHILVVAENQQVLDKIKEVHSGTIFSLEQQLEGKKIGRGLLNLYVDSGNLQSQFNNSRSLPHRIISSLAAEDLYLTLHKEKAVWVFGPVDEISLSAVDLRSTLRSLPDNFDIFISQISLAEIFGNFMAADKNFQQTAGQTVSNLEAVYGFDFSSTIRPLLSRQAEFLVLNTGKDNALGFDYVLILPEVSEKEIQGFEELVRIILSQKLPKETLRQLPDGTFVTELIADVNSWSWQETDLDQKFLSEPRLNFEIAYLKQDSRLFIASSKDLFKTVLEAQEISLENLASRCEIAFGGDDFLIINHHIKTSFSDILPRGLTVLSATPKNGLTGCIF